MTAINVYNNDYLGVKNYTRQMISADRATDLIDLVSYTLDCNFIEAVKGICNEIGISYYYDFSEDIPESFKILQLISDMQQYDEVRDEKPIQPIDPEILNYYKPYVNDLFHKDGIDYRVQREFGIGYDEYSNRITIPIFSETGDLIGVKGRLFKEQLNENEVKYLYLEPVPKGRVLYGLNKTMPYISRENTVYIFESEKGVMQAFSYGNCNSVATGGKTVSAVQIDMLTRLGAKLVFCFDKDVKKTEIEELAARFVDGVPIYYMYDTDGKLEGKQSPTDSREVWRYMLKNNIYRIK